MTGKTSRGSTKKVKIKSGPKLKDKKATSPVQDKDELVYIDKLLQKRVYSAYTKGRKDPRVTYEEPVTKREWWRVTVKETPVPGTYKCRDFLDVAAMNPVQASYNFAGQGRSKEAGIARSGELLLPGAYQHRDFLRDLENRRIASSFKSSGRSRTPTGFKDKDVEVPPWQYDLIRPPVNKMPSKHSAFRSQSSRFPSLNFKPKEGPPPGAYNPCQPTYRYKISSSFCSQTTRFGTSCTKVPGPGTYEPTIYTKPHQPSLRKMAKMHGLYFQTAFQA
ncbi:protein STPG4-like [Styela clava]